MNFYFKTPKGTVSIIYKNNTQRFHIIFKDEDLGNNHSPQAAASDAAGGHTFSHSSGIDLADLGIPEDLQQWDQGNP